MRFDVAWNIRTATIINCFILDITEAFGMLDVINRSEDARISCKCRTRICILNKKINATEGGSCFSRWRWV